MTADRYSPRRREIGQAVRVSDSGEHWEHIYATRASTDVSWYQQSPDTSLRLIKSVVSSPSAAVLDVGGGASSLVDHLLAEGFTDVTVLDVSEHALDEVRQRVGARTSGVRFVRHNLLTWSAARRYTVWHDRAVFHFLIDPAERDSYVAVARRSLREGGTAVIGTFAEDGPTHCSGLPVARYSPHALDAVFAEGFSPIAHEREEHVTPAGVIQPFTWAMFRRT